MFVGLPISYLFVYFAHYDCYYDCDDDDEHHHTDDDDGYSVQLILRHYQRHIENFHTLTRNNYLLFGVRKSLL